jgi:predicted small lipoprotein YifL
MRRSLQAALCLAILLALAACGGGGSGPGVLPPGSQASSSGDGTDSAAHASFTETWTELSGGTDWIDGDAYGRWTDQWDGYGTIGVVPDANGDALALSPQALSPYDHSALVTTTAPIGNFSAAVTLTTVAQLNPSPNPWEVGWVLWAYADNTHFYAFTPQPNGWELTKEDPAYAGNQRFLVTGSTPKFPVGATYVVGVIQQGTTMTVTVNGTRIVQFTDAERPYMSGALGLYCEESTVQYGRVAANVPPA